MGIGFCFAFFCLVCLGGQNFQNSLVFFRFSQGFCQSQSQSRVRDGGNSQACAAYNETKVLLGEGNPDTLLLRAYEADNYLVLVDDYLALLRMMELAEAGENQQVKEMAEARRDARIALMDRLMRTKESYLQPWNLRNHSIFMQFFEDLRVYLENTPAAEQKLDFLDMRYLASQRFFWLR